MNFLPKIILINMFLCDLSVLIPLHTFSASYPFKLLITLKLRLLVHISLMLTHSYIIFKVSTYYSCLLVLLASNNLETTMKKTLSLHTLISRFFLST